jgi:hypothetical protein
MTRRGRQRGLLPRIAAILVVALFLAAPAAHTGARQQDDELGRSAQALIGEKLSTGEIDYETSLVYRAYALFDDPRLPSDLTGNGSVFEDNAFFGEVQYNWNNLSPETQKILTPYVVRPTDSQSIFYKSLAEGPRTLPNAEAAPTYAQSDCSDNWFAKDSAQYPFKVWTHCTGDYEQDLATAIEIIDDFWQREVELMGPPVLDTGSAEQGGDERIDIYFVDDEADRVERRGGDYISEQTLAHAGSDAPFNGRKSSGYVVARRPNIGDPELNMTMAHEFFHVLQDAHNYEIAFGFKGSPFNADFDTLTYSEFWFVEATAMWVESFIYRNQIDPDVLQRSTHSYFVFGFQGTDRSLQYSPRQGGVDFEHIYGAYIYFLFLEQEVGPQAIAQMWKDLENVSPDDFDGTMQIINDILPFEEHFREFTVRNLNLDLEPGDPIDPSYIDLDRSFPEGTVPTFENESKSQNRLVPSPGGSEPLRFEDTISSLSAHYYRFDTDADVTQVTFDLTGLAPSQAVDLDLVVKIRDKGWERRQLDPSKPITFCREIPEDNVARMYLVITNHDMNEATSVKGSFTVTADDAPCG